MDKLNDMIWSPEDENLISPQGAGMGTVCMIEKCLVAFCPFIGGQPDPPPGGWYADGGCDGFGK